MTKVVGIIQARLTSIRLKRKAVLPLAGRPVIHHLFDRAKRIKRLDGLVLALPEGDAHDPIVDAAACYPDIEIVRGPDDELVTRFLMAADATGADVLLRMWGDCPATDPDLGEGLLQAFLNTDVDCALYPNDSGYPEGVETQVLSVEALRTLEREAADPKERENMLPFFTRQASRFQVLRLYRKPDRGHLKCLLDTEPDYRRITDIFEILYPRSPHFGVAELEALAEERPDLFDRNVDKIAGESSP